MPRVPFRVPCTKFLSFDLHSFFLIGTARRTCRCIAFSLYFPNFFQNGGIVMIFFCLLQTSTTSTLGMVWHCISYLYWKLLIMVLVGGNGKSMLGFRCTFLAIFRLFFGLAGFSHRKLKLHLKINYHHLLSNSLG